MYTETELDARHALVKLDGKAIQSGLPITYRHDPILADVVQCQVEQFKHGFIGWKRASGLVISLWLMFTDSIGMFNFITPTCILGHLEADNSGAFLTVSV